MSTLRPDIPEALEHFVMRAMEQQPDRRHDGMEEVIEALHALAAPVSLAEQIGERRASVALWWSQRGRLVVTGGAALVVVGAATWAILDWSSGGRATRPSLLGGASTIDTVGIRTPEGLLQLRDIENERRREEARARRPATPERRRPAHVEVTRPADEERQQREPEVIGPADEERLRQPDAEAARVGAEAAPALHIAQPAEPAAARSPATALSAEALFRIRAQAQQKLYSHGLFRVSTADRWGVTVEIGPHGEVVLSGRLRDTALYNEAIRLVREVPGVEDVQAGDVEVADTGTAPAEQDEATDKQ